MADNTKIEWTEATWNPITGCSLASPGCTNCYAMQLAGTRLKHSPSRKGLTQPSKAGAVWTGEVRFNNYELTHPLRWKRPRMIFVCAHGDLFHESVPDAWIDRIFAVMALCPQHTFQVLTKRSARMREYLGRRETHRRVFTQAFNTNKSIGFRVKKTAWFGGEEDGPLLPLPNVWLGVSVEDQQRADERIPDLLATPAAIRWISAEPLLGPVDLQDEWFGTMHISLPNPGNTLPDIKFSEDATIGGIIAALGGLMTNNDDGLDWVVVGGESGAKARGSTAEVEYWMRSLLSQCQAAGVPFFGKQNYRKLPLPDDLMVREYPHG